MNVSSKRCGLERSSGLLNNDVCVAKVGKIVYVEENSKRCCKSAPKAIRIAVSPVSVLQTLCGRSPRELKLRSAIVDLQ